MSFRRLCSDKLENTMHRKERKLALWIRIFLALACTSFILGNVLAVIFYISAKSTVNYDAEMIMSGLSALAILGMQFTAFLSCTLAAGIGNIISIFFTSFSISFLSKTADAPRALCIFLSILLILSILALLLTLPTYLMLSFFLGI